MTKAELLGLIGIKIPDNNIKKIKAKDVRDSYALMAEELYLRANIDASNIDDYIDLWKAKLGGGDFDTSTLMLIADWTLNGKIRSDKIESLALLDLIISVQTSIADFAANSGGYTFQKNDLIAVPDGSGKYSFYIYTGGVKTDLASYLAIGISNVNISQVVGLQNALNALQNQINNKQDKSLFSALQDKWIHYYDAATARFQPILKFVLGTDGNPNQLEFSGRIKADAVILPPNSNPAVANRLRSDGSGLFFANSSANERKISIGSVFNYTPSGNFSLSAIKTAAESAGYIWNDLTVEILLGANNFTCNIDTAVGTIVYLTRTGSGSISFTSTRTLDSGIDNITILSGNNSSFAAIVQKSDKDYLKIKIY